MKTFPWLVIVGLAGALVPPTISAADEPWTLSVHLTRGEYVAIRVNHSAGSDFRLPVSLRHCTANETSYESTFGSTAFEIQGDRIRRQWAIFTHNSWEPDSDSGEVNLNGERVRLGPERPISWCPAQITHGILVPQSAPGSTTVIVLSGAPLAWANATLDLRAGSVEIDVVTGRGVYLTPTDFERGVHVSTYNDFTGAGAGGALMQEIRTQRDFVGFFQPTEHVGIGPVVSACTVDGEDCDWRACSSFHPLVSQGPATYDVRMYARLRAHEAPRLTVAGLELPDDTYLPETARFSPC